MKEDKIFSQSKQVWEDNLKLFPHTVSHYPDENLVRLFSGRYVPVPQPPARVMDHGFGHANNLVFLLSKGYECAGCEISNNLINEAQKLFKIINKTVDLRLIKSLEIPFDDESFDVIVSWNAIHYNGTREAALKVISELRRALKPGGVLLLSTVHPDSKLFLRSQHLGNGSYIVKEESQYDNRQGLSLFFTRTEEELADLFVEFSEVKIGNSSFYLFNPDKGPNACFLVYAVK